MFAAPPALSIAFVLLALALCPPAQAAAKIGQPAPACTLAALGERPLRSLDMLRGKVVYVDFWASWCPPCAKSFPRLDALSKELAGRGFEVLGVNVDEQPGDAEAFLARRPVGFGLAATPRGECPRAFGVEAMPSGYLIDRNGILRSVHAGYRDGDERALRAAVIEVLDADTQP